MSPSDDTPAAPLSGVTVVDLSRYLPGPFAAHLLASLGARVLKVEEPTLGDPVRFAPPFVGGRSALAAPLLAGVESVALDLKKPAARAVLEDLLEDADVLLESSRPGTLARWGLEPETLRRRFPRLVICSLSGWGQDGPVAGRSGHDLTYQAVAGTLAPTATMPAHPWADLVGGWSMCGSVLAALVERGRTGAGTWIDAALFDAAVHANLLGWAGDADRPRAAGEPVRCPATTSTAPPTAGTWRWRSSSRTSGNASATPWAARTFAAGTSTVPRRRAATWRAWWRRGAASNGPPSWPSTARGSRRSPKTLGRLAIPWWSIGPVPAKAASITRCFGTGRRRTDRGLCAALTFFATSRRGRPGSARRECRTTTLGV